MPVEHMEYKLVHLLQWMRVHDEIINFVKSLVKCCPKTKKNVRNCPIIQKLNLSSLLSVAGRIHCRTEIRLEEVF